MYGFSVFEQWVSCDFCVNLYTRAGAVGALFIFMGTDRELWICPWSGKIRSRFSWRKVIRSAQVFVLGAACSALRFNLSARYGRFQAAKRQWTCQLSGPLEHIQFTLIHLFWYIRVVQIVVLWRIFGPNR